VPPPTVLSLGAGALFALAGAPRDLWAAGIGGLFLWMAWLDRRVWGVVPGAAFARGAVEGLAFGAGANAVALGWSVGLLERFAAFPAPAAWATSLLLWIAQGLPHGIATAAAAGLGATLRSSGGAERAGPWLLAATLPACVAVFPAIFPWSLATALLPLPTLVQGAELGGETLVSAGLVATIVALTEALRRGPRSYRGRAALVAVLVPAAAAAHGTVRWAQVTADREAAPHLVAGLVQPNVPVGAKRDRARYAERRAALHRATRALVRQGAELVVWPETAHPYPIRRDAEVDQRPPWSIRPVGARVPILAGVIARGQRRDPGTGERARFNSVVALGPNGRIRGISDKVVLVPFGERVPFCPQLPGVRRLAGGGCGLTPGARPEVLEPAPGLRVGVLNCYEDVLAAQARVVAREGPGLLVNVTNDAWFGDTGEPHLHLAVARFRAIEARRELLRSTNTGVTAHVAATGEVVARLPVFEEGTLRTTVPRLTGPPTFWVRHGDWVTPGLAGVVAGVMLAVVVNRRRGRIGPRTSGPRACP